MWIVKASLGGRGSGLLEGRKRSDCSQKVRLGRLQLLESDFKSSHLSSSGCGRPESQTLLSLCLLIYFMFPRGVHPAELQALGKVTEG